MGFYGDLNGINGTYNLVNIQKTIENCYLWCIFPLIAWWIFP
jgi:hypothetical protein